MLHPKQLLKLIGILLFLSILMRIDRGKLVTHMSALNWGGVLLVYASTFIIYAIKALRFQVLVKSAGLPMSRSASWKLCNIGVFLAVITPAKAGELGKAAYLKNAGMPLTKAVAMALLDRLFDIAAIGIIAAIGVGILFGWRWTALSLLAGGFLCATYMLLHKRTALATFTAFFRRHVALTAAKMGMVLGITFVSWICYFLWTVAIARLVGIGTPVHILTAAFTITGILTFLPIAPSGLGTRDVALLYLLAPYGVTAEQSVALAFLIFCMLILSGVPGLYYWYRGLVIDQRYSPSIAP
ncbi:MAG: lysylphosphatidylglycerol synthase transmembrane domain-containing protein [Candidatus Peribacteraceae bacterium]|nr:lysylphosphatidylglycerol synthase transmembrane domain-containing protein [Candidatus Peribacteraceae bacterium]